MVVCTKCGGLLPRPHVTEKDGTVRAIKGYKTSYRRMSPHAPANTITMNSGVASSDVKLHYNQARVLTLKEIMVLSTFHDITNKKATLTSHVWAGKYSFDCVMAEKDYLLQKNIIRQSLGESIPPLAMQRMVESLIQRLARVKMSTSFNCGEVLRGNVEFVIFDKNLLWHFRHNAC